MHIALVSDDYPPENFIGGIGSYSRTLAGCLIALGHRVTVVTWTAGRPSVRDEDGMRVHGITAFGSRLVGSHRLFSPLRWSLGVSFCLRKIHRNDPIDVVEAPDYRGEGACTALWGKLPLVVRGHGTLGMHLGIEHRHVQNRSTRLLLRLERIGLRRADLVLADSHYLANLYRALYAIPVARIEVQHYGLSAPQTFMECARADNVQRAPTHEGVVFLSVGRQEWRKGSDVLVRAFALANVPNKRLVMVGGDTNTAPTGGSMREYCYALADELGITDRIQVLDKVSPEDLLPYYLAGDVFLHPSRSDTTPLVYLEAMATGLPVVGTAVGGVPEIVTSESGELVPSNDVGAVASALEKLGMEAPLRRTMGEEGRRQVSAVYSPERHADHMVQWYRRTQENHRRKHC